MQQSRLSSLLLSALLHGGIIAAALFWPVSATPPVDLDAPVIDIGIYTIGSPGAAPEQVPSSPKAPEQPPAPQAPPEQPKAPETPPDQPPPTVPEPEVPAVPIPQPDAPKEPEQPKAPEKPAEPPKPEPKPEPKPQPKPKPKDVLGGALRDLGQGRQPSSIADALGELKKAGGGDTEGTGPGGSDGDGVGIRGSYMQSLVSRIKPNWEYQGRADRRNPQAVVEITIAGDGTITEAKIITSSGDAAFDGSVLKAVYDTIRVEPPPSPALSKVRVPFSFEAISR